MKLTWKLILMLVSLTNTVYSWNDQQLEVFDAVEEVKFNFYEFLKITQDASLSSIKSAFRQLSLELHPDKNQNENADEEFRHLVLVYETLKDLNKRKYYDEVLENGLPNWRSAVYYYRHVRKIGMLELCLFLLVFVSIGQYTVAWASYFEHKYTLSQLKGRKQKKIPANIELSKPSLLNTLPIQLPKLVLALLTMIPTLVTVIKLKAEEKLKEPSESEEEEESIHEIRTTRKRKTGFVIPDGPTFKPVYIPQQNNIDNTQKDQIAPIIGGLWTDDDLSELAQLLNRYPGGTPDRWNLIAENIGRSVNEITYMANKLKTNGYRLNSQENKIEEITPKIKTKGVKVEETDSISNWSQEQQSAIENALARYPKGYVDRWDYIAECVSGKTKEECILRYKYLVEMVKNRRT